MARGGKAVVRRVSALLSVALLKSMALLPLGTARGLARASSLFAYLAVPRLRRVTLDNLDLAYGDSVSESEKRRIARGAVENLFVTAMEFPFLARLTRENVKQYVAIRGWENIDFSRGVLFISAHMANWEWMIPAMAHRGGGKVSVVIRELDDPLLNTHVDRLRRVCGMEPIAKHGAGDEVIQKLRDGWVVGVMIDQSPRDNAVPTTFFGKPCWSTIAPVMAAVRAKTPVHFAAVRREQDGTYTLELQPAMDFVRTGNLREDIVVNTQRCQDVLEAAVRAHPEQWLWMHRRWKTRPKMQKEWETRLKKDALRREARGGAS
jgi:KDO2-lipid IV(A) lauroyltransferase